MACVKWHIALGKIAWYLNVWQNSGKFLVAVSCAAMSPGGCCVLFYVKEMLDY